VSQVVFDVSYIVHELHSTPSAGRAAKSFLKADGHLRCNRCLPGYDIVEFPTGNAEGFGSIINRNA